MKTTIVLAALAAALLLASCTTTDHAVLLKPVEAGLPVSASSLYATGQGAVVSSEGYDIVDHFAFTKKMEGPVGVKGYSSSLDIGAELGALAAAKRADAVVNLRIIPTQFDPGNTFAVGPLKIAGSMFLGFGGLFGLMALMDEDMGETLGPMALAFGGVGGAGLIVSATLQPRGRTVWTINIEGDLVRRR